MRWLLLFALSCQQGRAQQQPPPTPTPVRAIDAHGDAPIDAFSGWYDDAQAAMTIDDVLDVLARAEEPDRICFAVSANHRRVACGTDSSYSENDLQTIRGVKILGELGTATSEWTYVDANAIAVDEVAKAIDRNVIDEIRRALSERHYEPFKAASVKLVTTATISGHDLRRDRGPDRYHPDERIELRCGSTWQPIRIDDAQNIQYGDATEINVFVSSFDQRQLLFVVDGHWGIEGGQGHTHGAQLVDVVAACR